MDSRIVLLINLKCRRVVGDLPLSAFFFSRLFYLFLKLGLHGLVLYSFMFH